MVVGLLHMLAIYHFYVGQVHYAIGGPSAFWYHRVVREGKIVASMSGSEIIESLAEGERNNRGGIGRGNLTLGSPHPLDGQ